MVLRLGVPPSHLEGLLKTQVAGPPSRIPQSVGVGWEPAIAFLSSQVRLQLLVQEPHFEKHRVYRIPVFLHPKSPKILLP